MVNRFGWFLLEPSQPQNKHEAVTAPSYNIASQSKYSGKERKSAGHNSGLGGHRIII